MMKKIIAVWGSLMLLGLFSCTKEKTTSIADPGALGLEKNSLEVISGGGLFEISVEQEKLLGTLNASVAQTGESWCQAEIADRTTVSLRVSPTAELTDRSTVVTLTDGFVREDIIVRQYGAYLLKDKEVVPFSAEATTQEPGYEIENTLNDDRSSYFNSKMGIGEYTDWPFTLEYHFKEGISLDYAIYYPRMDAGNRWGAFGKFEIWVATHDDPEFQKMGTYDGKESTDIPTLARFSSVVENVKTVRFDVYSAYESRISCGKMEFYLENQQKSTFDPLTLFTDLSCSELKPGITRADLDQAADYYYRNLGLRILDDAYDPGNFRIQQYRPYQDPKIMAAINKTARYSMSDNPTGIYATAGEEMVIHAGDLKGQSISVIIRDVMGGFGNTSSFLITEGANRITPSMDGLIYVSNLTNDDIPLVLENDADRKKAEEKSVRLHITGGTVNGYYDSQKHDPAQAAEILNKATYREIDVLGKYAHVVWTVQHFVADGTDLHEMIERMDKSVRLQHELMGLYKYHTSSNKRLFANRMHLTVDYKASSPNASDYRTVYTPGGYREIFTTSDGFNRRLWVVGHEVGHVNQTRPGLKWTAMTEVSNNIFCCYMQEQFPGAFKKLMYELKDGKNLYERSRDSIVWHNVLDPSRPPYELKGRAHVMECLSHQHEYKLPPFWQLKLYVTNVRGKNDFYPDLFEYYRTTPNLNTSETTEGVYQLDFVRQVCRLAHMNLLDFFRAWGFLNPVPRIVVNDYGNKPFEITQGQINALVAEIEAAGYDPYPAENPPLYMIDDENYKTFK